MLAVRVQGIIPHYICVNFEESTLSVCVDFNSVCFSVAIAFKYSKTGPVDCTGGVNKRAVRLAASIYRIRDGFFFAWDVCMHACMHGHIYEFLDRAIFHCNWPRRCPASGIEGPSKASLSEPPSLIEWSHHIHAEISAIFEYFFDFHHRSIVLKSACV